MVYVGRNLDTYPESRAKVLRKTVQNLLDIEDIGYTADQIAAKVGEHTLSIRPRVSELYKKELVFDTGKRGRNNSGKKAIVWKAIKWHFAEMELSDADYDEHLGCASYPNCDEGGLGCRVRHGANAEMYGHRD